MARSGTRVVVELAVTGPCGYDAFSVSRRVGAWLIDLSDRDEACLASMSTWKRTID